MDHAGPFGSSNRSEAGSLSPASGDSKPGEGTLSDWRPQRIQGTKDSLRVSRQAGRNIRRQSRPLAPLALMKKCKELEQADPRSARIFMVGSDHNTLTATQSESAIPTTESKSRSLRRA